MVIPFDIEMAKLALKFDSGVIKTLSGDKVFITDWERQNFSYPIYGKIFDLVSKSWFPASWTKSGHYEHDNVTNELDLIIEFEL